MGCIEEFAWAVLAGFHWLRARHDYIVAAAGAEHRVTRLLRIEGLHVCGAWSLIKTEAATLDHFRTIREARFITAISYCLAA